MYTFKIGDKGKTKLGWDYLITDIDSLNEDYPIEAKITFPDGSHTYVVYTAKGTFIKSKNTYSDLDLMPPKQFRDLSNVGNVFYRNGAISQIALDPNVNIPDGLYTIALIKV